MEKTYIQWNMVNWITIVLMVALGSAITGFAISQISKYRTPMSAAE